MSQKKHVWLWVGLAAALAVARYAVPALAPGTFLYVALGGAAVGVLVLLWWIVFSGAPWLERLGGIALMALALAGTAPLLHVSMATAGMGMLFYIHAIPLLALAFFSWALLSRGLGAGARWASMVATVVLATGVWTLLRTGGITGSGQSDFAWRWSETPEEHLLATAEDLPRGPALPVVAEPIEADWPGFRGPRRDGVISGVRLETDWSASPPVELWRRPIGPGWSSFAVGGDLLYTQEQRGDEEIVACYDATTGEPVWMHADPVRFYESNGGAGPRGTPTLRDRRVYAFGATGLLNVLDAADGTVVWSRDVSSDSGVAVPGWGFASSPLVVGDVVIVAAAGKLVAYDLENGEPRWSGPKGGGGYSSPHRMTIDGVEQVLLQNATGLISVSPADGALLWEHDWPGFRIVQPALLEGGDLLISTSGDAGGIGSRRLRVAHGDSGWTTEELWTSNRLKPYFNDFVVHEGYAYGFDGRILACIDLEKGERQWKGGRYGNGQLVLLPDQDVLLVLSEDGELALVAAKPDGFTELARAPALAGKTWNHPVLVHDRLFVRNGQEIAAFRLALGST